MRIAGVDPFEASRPVAIYPSGGIGDHLAALPALRALVQMLPQRVALICIRGSSRVLFSEIGLRSIHEVKFFDQLGGGLSMSQFPKTAPLPGWFWQEKPARVRKAGAKQPDVSGDTDSFWTFDAQAVAKEVGDSDLLISLTPWYSASADRLLEILFPRNSIGFSAAFDTSLVVDFKRNLADTFFEVAKALDPSLKIENFVGDPVASSRYRKKALALRKRISSTARVLAVHVDTMQPKMWSPDRFGNVVKNFLARHPDFLVFLVGCPDARSVQALSAERVVHCFPLDLQTSLALVAESDLFLGVDSCMLHCADLHRVPGVGIFGPTEPGTWGFRFAPHRHVYGNGAMESISEAEVLEGLESLAQHYQPAKPSRLTIKSRKEVDLRGSLFAQTRRYEMG